VSSPGPPCAAAGRGAYAIRALRPSDYENSKPRHARGFFHSRRQLLANAAVAASRVSINVGRTAPSCLGKRASTTSRAKINRLRHLHE
jgi:hypothetical protein